MSRCTIATFNPLRNVPDVREKLLTSPRGRGGRSVYHCCKFQSAMMGMNQRGK